MPDPPDALLSADSLVTASDVVIGFHHPQKANDMRFLPSGGLATVLIYRRAAVALMLPLLLLMAACGGGSDSNLASTATGAPAQDASQPAGNATTVEGVRLIEVLAAFVEPRYTPDPIVLKAGEPVQFSITSADTRHTFTITELNIDVPVNQKLIGGAAVSQVITPQQTGTFRLWCRIHENAPVMVGEIQVVP